MKDTGGWSLQASLQVYKDRIKVVGKLGFSIQSFVPASQALARVTIAVSFSRDLVPTSAYLNYTIFESQGDLLQKANC